MSDPASDLVRVVCTHVRDDRAGASEAAREGVHDSVSLFYNLGLILTRTHPCFAEPFTAQEDSIIRGAQAKLGNKWVEIAKMLPGRSDNAVKNRWNSHIQHAIRKQTATGEGQGQATPPNGTDITLQVSSPQQGSASVGSPDSVCPLPSDATSSPASSSAASPSSHAAPAGTSLAPMLEDPACLSDLVQHGLHAPQLTSFQTLGSEHRPVNAVLQQPAGGVLPERDAACRQHATSENTAMLLLELIQQERAVFAQYEMMERQRHALVQHDIVRQELLLRLQAELGTAHLPDTKPAPSTLPSAAPLFLLPPTGRASLQELQSHSSCGELLLGQFGQKQVASAHCRHRVHVEPGPNRSHPHALGMSLALAQVPAALATSNAQAGAMEHSAHRAANAPRPMASDLNLTAPANHPNLPPIRPRPVSARCEVNDAALDGTKYAPVKLATTSRTQGGGAEGTDALLQLADAAEALSRGSLGAGASASLMPLSRSCGEELEALACRQVSSCEMEESSHVQMVMAEVARALSSGVGVGVGDGAASVEYDEAGRGQQILHRRFKVHYDACVW